MKITDILDAKLNLGCDIMDLEHDKICVIEKLKQLHSDMEQEAEPEGGDVCNQYADAIHKAERELETITREIQDKTEKLNELENLI